MKKSRYVQCQDGEAMQLGKRRACIIECCDCALVHLLRFRITRDGKLTMRAWRLKRQTGQRRRYRKVGPHGTA